MWNNTTDQRSDDITIILSVIYNRVQLQTCSCPDQCMHACLSVLLYVYSDGKKLDRLFDSRRLFRKIMGTQFRASIKTLDTILPWCSKGSRESSIVTLYDAEKRQSLGRLYAITEIPVRLCTDKLGGRVVYHFYLLLFSQIYFFFDFLTEKNLLYI